MTHVNNVLDRLKLRINGDNNHAPDNTKWCFIYEWKKCSNSVGCSKAESKNFRPAADPLHGGAGRTKFNQLEMVTTFTRTTNPVWWGSMHAISSYRGNRPTNTQTNPQTGSITINCTAKLSAQCNKIKYRGMPLSNFGYSSAPRSPLH